MSTDPPIPPAPMAPTETDAASSASLHPSTTPESDDPQTAQQGDPQARGALLGGAEPVFSLALQELRERREVLEKEIQTLEGRRDQLHEEIQRTFTGQSEAIAKRVRGFQD
jgi:hypothetical protein